MAAFSQEARPLLRLQLQLQLQNWLPQPHLRPPWPC